METLKKCGRCKVDKLLSAFNKNRSTKDGFSWDCKECRRETARRAYYSDHDASKAIHRQRSKEQRDRLTPEQLARRRVSAKNYNDAKRQRDPEAFSRQGKEWRAANQDRIKEYLSDPEHRAKKLEQNRQYGAGSARRRRPGNEQEQRTL